MDGSVPAEPVASGTAKTQKKKKPGPRRQVPVTKTEQAIRNFQALQIILNNPIWSPVVLEIKTRPSTLYAPRKRFDTNFANTEFREGLKAASLLATTFSFDPEKIEFVEKTIHVIKNLPLDPKEKIKSYIEASK